MAKRKTKKKRRVVKKGNSKKDNPEDRLGTVLKTLLALYIPVIAALVSIVIFLFDKLGSGSIILISIISILILVGLVITIFSYLNKSKTWGYIAIGVFILQVALLLLLMYVIIAVYYDIQFIVVKPNDVFNTTS